MRVITLPRFVLAVTGVFWVAVCHAQDVLSGLAAVVNTEPITFGQVREIVAPKERQAHENLRNTALVERIKEIRLDAINELIDRSLILQEFKSKGYSIPEYLIDERVNEIIRDSFGGDRQAFLRTLAAQELTIEKFREYQRDSIIVQEMRRQATRGATTVSEQRIQDFYQQHAADYSTPEEAKLRMIVIRGSSETDSRRRVLEEIREKVAGGGDFGELARMYSEGSEQEAFGDVGWVNRKHFNAELTKVAFSLKPGEMSQIVELGGSYYLLWCEARKQATIKPLKEVRTEIEKTLLGSERQKQQQEWLYKLRKKAYIKLF